MGLSDFSEFVKVLAANIRRARLQHQYRQVDVAAKVGMNYRHYQNLESGSVNPKLETIHRLAKLFGHTVADLTETALSPFDFPGHFDGDNRAHLQMLDSLDVGAGVLDKEGKLIYLNSTLAQIMQLPITSMLGRCPAEYFIAADRERYMKVLEKRRNGKTEPYFCEIQSQDGASRLIFVHVQTYLTPAGQFEGSLALFFDMTKAFNERLTMMAGQPATAAAKQPMADGA